MKKFYLLIVLLSNLAFAQNKGEAEKKIQDGVALHDQGKYEEALLKYEEALALDQNNLFALSEKAMTLDAAAKHDEAVETSKLILKLYPNEDNKTVYVTYGNALDHADKKDLAIKIYNEGIKKYPDYYQLYYNKAITLFNVKETENAIQAFQQATKLNPNHASSFNALSVLNSSNRIASILASSRYLVLDSKSPRAESNLAALLSMMNQGVSQKNDNSISLTINPETMDKIGKKKKSENDFSTIDFALSMSAALDYDEKNKDKTQTEKFIAKFETMCKVMAETKKNQKGYFWEFLAPYFIEMESKKLIEPFAYTIFSTTKNKDVEKYLVENPHKIDEFYNWSQNYNWK